MVVAAFQPFWLPPMQEWFSGAMPYPALVACQFMIIALYGKICVDFWRMTGFFAIPRARLGEALMQFGSVYLLVMIFRYIIRMSLYPAERWTGGAIPIVFHCVLATFLLVLAWYHLTGSSDESPKSAYADI